MKFSIITPTHKRVDKLIRAVDSIKKQTYTDWEMIIVNDSPFDAEYQSFASSISDPRIHYYVNESNLGVNYSRNFALDKASPDSLWTIFLDDDDYLAEDALETFFKLIKTHPTEKWFFTNRAYSDGKLDTDFPRSDTRYSYIKDCLLLRRCRGEVTRCIKTKLLTENHIRYSTYIKQAEEWIFYYQISLLGKFYYHSHNSTITDGYDIRGGLNFRKRTRSEQFKTLGKFILEGQKLKILYHPTFLLYLCLRFIRLLVKPTS